MGLTATLTPDLVRQLIRDQEIPLRSQDRPSPTVAAVFRFGTPVASTIQHHALLERGMDHARSLIRECESAGRSFPSGLVIVAEQLSGGRGRFQRSWHAPVGGLWMTVVLVNTLLPVSSSLYTLATGVAAGEAITTLHPGAHLKWVNDVHVGGRKVCGILCESLRGQVSGEEYILLGIGININNAAFPPELAGQAASLKELLGREVEVAALAGLVLAKLAWYIGLLHHSEQQFLTASDAATLADPELFEQFLAGQRHPLVDNWLALSDTVGRKVRFGYDVQQKPLFDGVVAGIGCCGNLLLRLPDGSQISQNSGEIIYLDC
ncbi:MAG: biotin--[acetyl-CoA-carboxylase] ligase [Desulfobulbaceae bacterium]|nr:biotin--[acetyl-CoA-carboxylase] ligase [Desulfobulbaceae bacterium]